MQNKANRTILIALVITTFLPMLIAGEALGWRISWPRSPKAELVVENQVNSGNLDQNLYTIIDGKIDLLDDCGILYCGTPGNDIETSPGLGGIELIGQSAIENGLLPKKGKIFVLLLCSDFALRTLRL